MAASPLFQVRKENFSTIVTALPLENNLLYYFSEPVVTITSLPRQD